MASLNRKVSICFLPVMAWHRKGDSALPGQKVILFTDEYRNDSPTKCDTLILSLQCMTYIKVRCFSCVANCAEFFLFKICVAEMCAVANSTPHVRWDGTLSMAQFH